MCSGDKLFYLQADEVYHENAGKEIHRCLRSKSNSVSFKFLHFRNGFDRYIKNPTYNRAIRIINKNGVHSVQDGFNFGGDVNPIHNSDAIVYHIGWCFPKNICNKHINHAKLYPGVGSYMGAKKVCQEMLDSGNISTDVLCKKVDSRYKFNKFSFKDLPRFAKHLVNDKEYDAYHGLEILSDDLKG